MWSRTAAVSGRNAAIKAALQNGPISIGVSVGNWSRYKSGVMTAASCYSSLSHAVALVGWDDAADGGNGAWILQNSWGSGWGDNGFMKLAMNYDAGVYTEGTCRMFYIPESVTAATAVTN